MLAERPSGWSWFETAPASASDLSDSELCRACARCFTGSDGQAVLAYLTRSVLDRRLPPSASNAELRHLEGQRCAVAGLLAMIDRGRV